MPKLGSDFPYSVPLYHKIECLSSDECCRTAVLVYVTWQIHTLSLTDPKAKARDNWPVSSFEAVRRDREGELQVWFQCADTARSMTPDDLEHQRMRAGPWYHVCPDTHRLELLDEVHPYHMRSNYDMLRNLLAYRRLDFPLPLEWTTKSRCVPIEPELKPQKTIKALLIGCFLTPKESS